VSARGRDDLTAGGAPSTSASSSGAPAAGTGTLLLITTAICGIVTSVTMIGPLLLDLSRELGVSLGMAGLLAAASAVPQALGSPLAGLLSDRLGRRPMIVLSFAAVGALTVAAAGAPGFAALVGIRFITGAVGCLAPTSLMASVGDLFPAARRARAMGWFNLGFSLAAIGSVPLVGAIGGVFGWRVAFLAVGAAMLVLALAMRAWFPPVPAIAAGTSVVATYRAVWQVRGLLNVLGANLAERSMFGMLTFYLPAFLMLRFGMSAVSVAPALSAVAVGAIAGNALGGPLGDRLPRLGIFIASQLAAAALALALFGAPVPLLATVALAAVVGLVNAASRPSFLAFSSDLAPAQRGAMFGLIALANQSGMALGSALGALVIQLWGPRGLAFAAVAQGVVAAALMLPVAVRGAR
jgi:predicted MFS family arabinose efflux permease